MGFIVENNVNPESSRLKMKCMRIYKMIYIYIYIDLYHYSTSNKINKHQIIYIYDFNDSNALLVC